MSCTGNGDHVRHDHPQDQQTEPKSQCERFRRRRKEKDEAESRREETRRHEQALHVDVYHAGGQLRRLVAAIPRGPYGQDRRHEPYFGVGESSQ